MRTTIPFGTDGIRGPFGTPPLDEPSLQHIAETISLFIPNGSVAIARDTRHSGTIVSDILTKTLVAHGIQVVDCGILPTAALACVVVDDEMDLGVVITASHNPASDNGIKLFGSTGAKLSKEEQQRFQEGFLKNPTKKTGLHSIHPAPTKAWLSRLPKPDLNGVKILLDCAHGALSAYGKEVLEKCGATVTAIASEPNGANINANVGALHPPTSIGDHDIGLCFDGDADRLILCTHSGILDGDDILFLLKETIQGPLVGTIMSNGGLETALDNRLVRSKVGDQNVYNMMLQYNACVGAEPSGHIIFTDGNMPAGDGLYAALRILESCPLPLKSDWTRWPTPQQSIRFQTTDLPNGVKPSLEHWSSMEKAIQTGHRIVVRYSGTEPKLRILVEGPKAKEHSDAMATDFKALLKL